MSALGAAIGGAFIAGGVIYRSMIKSDVAMHEQAVMHHKAHDLPPPLFSENAPMYRANISSSKTNSMIAIVVGVIVLASTIM